jgi:ATP-binding cassette, subfamily C (CFTR/MRP), member 1
MAMTLPLTIVALYLIQRAYLPTSRQLRILELESRSPVYAQFLETVDGLSTIRALKWQDHFIAKADLRLDSSQTAYYAMFCIQRWLALVLDLTIAGLATLVVVLATNLRHSTSEGLIGVSLNAVLGEFISRYWLYVYNSRGKPNNAKFYSGMDYAGDISRSYCSSA